MLPLLFASLCTRAGAVLARYWLLPRSAVHTFSFASLCYPRQRFVPGRGPDTVTDTLLIIITGATHSLVPMPCYDPPRSVPLARASARQRWDVPHTFAHFHVCLRSGCDVAILYSWLTGGKRRFETDDFPRRDEKGQMRKSKHGA